MEKDGESHTNDHILIYLHPDQRVSSNVSLLRSLKTPLNAPQKFFKCPLPELHKVPASKPHTLRKKWDSSGFFRVPGTAFTTTSHGEAHGFGEEGGA